MNEPQFPANSQSQPGQPNPSAAAGGSYTIDLTQGGVVLPVIEEQAIIQRELVEAGRVRITRQVQEADELVRVPLQHDEVRVERVAVNQYLPAGSAPPPTRYEGEVMIIPVLREVAVVEKRLLLVEELRVTKQQITTEHTEPMHLRREDIVVERLPGAAGITNQNQTTEQTGPQGQQDPQGQQ